MHLVDHAHMRLGNIRTFVWYVDIIIGTRPTTITQIHIYDAMMIRALANNCSTHKRIYTRICVGRVWLLKGERKSFAMSEQLYLEKLYERARHSQVQPET